MNRNVISVRGLSRSDVLMALATAAENGINGMDTANPDQAVINYCRQYTGDDISEIAGSLHLKERAGVEVQFDKDRIFIAEYEELYPGLAAEVIGNLFKRRRLAIERALNEKAGMLTFGTATSLLTMIGLFEIAVAAELVLSCFAVSLISSPIAATEAWSRLAYSRTL